MSARPLDVEHRWGRRLAVDIPVQFGIGLVKRIDARLLNLSSSGALMTADYRLRVHAVVAVYIRMPRSGHATIEAHVTRVNNDDFGLEWCESGSRAIKHLVQTLWLRRVRHSPAAGAGDSMPAMSTASLFPEIKLGRSGIKGSGEKTDG